ncbi:MAG: hypothetical protein ACXVEI_12250 [Actinomycetota bacterium]
MAIRTAGRERSIWSKAFLLAVAVVVGAYFFQGIGVRNVLFDIVGVVAAAAMFVGIGRNRAHPRFAWGLLAAGTMLMAIGDIIFGTSQPVPSVADMLYVSAYVALTLGLVGLVRSGIPNRKNASLLDAVVVAAGVGIVGILLLIVPAAHPDGGGIAAKAVSLGYPAIDLALLIGLYRLVRRDTAQRTAFLLLGAGLVLRLIGDAGYAMMNFGSNYATGNAIDAFWLFSYACFGAALLHPAVGRVKVDASSIWIPRNDFAEDNAPEVYARAAAVIQSQALRFRTILGWAGGILLVLAGGVLLLGVSWHAPEVLLVSGAYGGSGILIVVASAVSA